jgi:hypothetical protein
MADKTKIKRTYMVFADQDQWIDNKIDEWPVDKSYIVRRALYYYMAQGHKKDKVLRGGKSESEDTKKIKRTYMVHKRHDSWINGKTGEWGVDKSFILRRALYYYMARGHKKDKKLKSKLHAEGVKLEA